jgi:hypothetical protein
MSDVQDRARSLVLAGLAGRLHDGGPPPDLVGLGPDVWPAVLDLAAAEQVAPLLHRAWRDAPGLPEKARARLHRAYVETAARNTLLLDELARALDRLDQADVPVIVAKGAALAETLYGNPALRPMVDIDLIVHGADLDRAIAALGPLGYGAPPAELAPGARLAYDNEVSLGRPDPRAVPIELHWSLFDDPHYQRRVPMGWFWATTEAASVAGRPARVLGPDALLLHLCGHLWLHHAGAGLLWHHDVAELLTRRAGDLDWPSVVRFAADWDLVRPLRAVLAAVAADWAAPVPATVLEALAAREPSPDEARRLAERSAPRDVARRLLQDTRGLGGARQQAAFLRANLLPDPAYMRARYGVRRTAALPAYYLYRWALGLRAALRRR